MPCRCTNAECKNVRTVLPTLAGVALLAGAALGPVGTADQPKPAAEKLPFRVPEGFVAERVAGPPLIEFPMFACFDDRGRLFVADSRGVNPQGEQLREKPAHVIRLLEDSDGDGRFDRGRVFADHLTYPEGVAWYRGAVFTAAPPGVWRLEDTQGKGAADRRQELVTGYVHTGVADELHGPSLGRDGRIYWGCGRFAHEIRRPGGPVLWKGRAPLLHRCRPDGGDLEMVSGAQGNPVKFAFSPEGDVFVCGTWGTRAESVGQDNRPREDAIIHCIAGGNYPMLDGDFFSPEFKHTPDVLPPLVYLGVAAACGMTRYEGDAFGAGFDGNLFSALYNLHVVRRHVLARDGSTFASCNEDFLVSDSPSFHPTDVLQDADGSLLVVDSGSWFSHCPTSQLGKAPVQGGIYRIRRKGVTPPADPRGLALAWGKMGPAELAGLLGDRRVAVRERAVDELARRGAVEAARDVLRKEPSAVVRCQAVWALARMDRPEARAAARLALEDADAGVRQAAVCVVALHRDAAALARLTQLVTTDTPAVRREAAAALGRLRQAAAVPALFDALRAGADLFLEHALLYALIEIGDRPATLPGLADPNPSVRRGALVALDQMDGGNLTSDLVTPLLNTDDPALRQAALAAVTARPAWAKEIVGFLRESLAQKEVPADRANGLRGALLALCGEGRVQQLVAAALRRPETSLETRLLLLEVMARAPLKELPAAWLKELAAALEDREERVTRQALAVVRARNLADFDAVLLRLAADKGRGEDVRVSALDAAAPRLARLAPGLMDFLVQCLHEDKPPLLRLGAATALGQANLNDRQRLTLARCVAAAGPLELPRLLPAFERSTNPEVGTALVAGLLESPGSRNLSAEMVRKVLRGYPAEVSGRARELLARLEPDGEKQAARLAELEPLLAGGDAGRGREVFFGKKATCATCHSVGSQGGRVGPDLSKIGAVRSGRDLLESIVFPSASFARGFEPYELTTRQGRVLTGVLARETADAVFLVDGQRSEVRVPRGAIESLHPGKVSIMPQGLDQQISRQELADLLAFLQSLK
jgi:putative membrane-bound dehydrogenase-like protein